MFKTSFSFLALALLTIPSCKGHCEDFWRKAVAARDVTLEALALHGKVQLALVNGTSNDIKINRMFSLGYRETSIKFLIDQNQMQKDTTPHGIPEILDPSKLQLTVSPGGIYGMIYELKDLKQMYNLQSGCYTMRASYSNPISDSSYTDIEITSNTFEVCIPK